MKYSKTSRRFFLHGAGAALTLPVLASLTTSSADAQAATKSFIGIGAWNGLYKMYGPESQLMPKTPENGSTLVRLSRRPPPRTTRSTTRRSPRWRANGGQISDIIDAEFTPYLGKMLMMQGFDYPALGYYHHSGQFGNWHQTAEQTEGNPDMATLDVVLSEYFAKVGLPGDMVAYSASWRDNQWGCSYRDRRRAHHQPLRQPAALWDKYFANAHDPDGAQGAARRSRARGLPSRCKNNPRLGSRGPARLDAHIEHLAATETEDQEVRARCATSCAPTTASPTERWCSAHERRHRRV